MPVGPAACCRTCLSPRVAPLDACADLNYCSGHGVCALGARPALGAPGGTRPARARSSGPPLSLARPRRRVRVPAGVCGRRLLLHGARPWRALAARLEAMTVAVTVQSACTPRPAPAACKGPAARGAMRAAAPRRGARAGCPGGLWRSSRWARAACLPRRSWAPTSSCARTSAACSARPRRARCPGWRVRVRAGFPAPARGRHGARGSRYASRSGAPPARAGRPARAARPAVTVRWPPCRRRARGERGRRAADGAAAAAH